MAHGTLRLRHRPRHIVPWTHEEELKKLRGREIALLDLNMDECVRGVLLDADKFTIQVSYQSELNQSAVATYYKHAIGGYMPIVS